MDLEHYEIEKLDELRYRFYSVGPKGKFEMRIKFSYIWQNTVNLGFGLLDPVSEALDDQVELRNSDSQKILATVANVVLLFLELRPSVRVYATGSTRSRTRLYQMGINRILSLLSDYIIQGYKLESRGDDVGVETATRQGGWQQIQLGIEYEAFLIYKESMLN